MHDEALYQKIGEAFDRLEQLEEQLADVKKEYEEARERYYYLLTGLRKRDIVTVSAELFEYLATSRSTLVEVGDTMRVEGFSKHFVRFYGMGDIPVEFVSRLRPDGFPVDFVDEPD